MSRLTVAEWRTARRALTGAARRYLAAEARGASPMHLAVLLGAWNARVQAALAAGLTPYEVGQAAGIVGTAPTWLGWDDVEAELAQRTVRWTA